MSDVTVKGPVAAFVLIVLIVSIGLNIWKFSQPQQAIILPAPGQSGLVSVPATLPSGEPDPLQHIPKNPQDAVGMPDATGGREVPGR